MPLKPISPQAVATAVAPRHGALIIADSNRTTTKWTTLGVEKAPLACAAPQLDRQFSNESYDHELQSN